MELNLFQNVVVPLMGCLTIDTIVAGVRGWLNRREAILLSLLWLAIGISIRWRVASLTTSAAAWRPSTT